MRCDCSLTSADEGSCAIQWRTDYAAQARVFQVVHVASILLFMCVTQQPKKTQRNTNELAILAGFVNTEAELVAHHRKGTFFMG